MTFLKWTRITKAEYAELNKALSGQREELWAKLGIKGLRMKPEGRELRYYASRCQA
jgi:hypothetical protein